MSTNIASSTIIGHYLQIVPAKTYHITLAYTTLILEAEYLLRVKAIRNWKLSRARLSSWNSKSSVKLL
jgi:hypothetical protein